jgi:hypothetical protein
MWMQVYLYQTVTLSIESNFDYELILKVSTNGGR